MPRYVAFLRGVMPTNAKMPELKRAFEAAGFTNVATVLASGNVVFDAPARSTAAIEKKAEESMAKHLGRAFPAFVHSIESLRKLLASDPYRGACIPAGAKRVVTFVHTPPAVPLRLPIERDGARILRFEDNIVFSAYERTPKGPVFMVLIEKAFGKDQTTRTWQTLEKIVAR